MFVMVELGEMCLCVFLCTPFILLSYVACLRLYLALLSVFSFRQ